MTAQLSVAVACVGLVIAGWAASRAPAAFPGANGKIAFTSSRDGNAEIYTMNADGTGQTRLTNNAASDSQPAWASGGTKIAFRSNRDGNLEIHTMNADGTGVVNRSTNAANDFEPAWSPDGTKIAFTSDRDGNFEIYTMNADGSGQVNRSTNAEDDEQPEWSPDGTKIAFTSDRAADANAEVYVMNADGSGQVNLTNAEENDLRPAWSPDGTKIAFQTTRDRQDGDLNDEIYTMNADGSGQVNRSANPAGDASPAWSPDGTKIAFSSIPDASNPNDKFQVYTMNADGSGRVNRSMNGVHDFEPDWQPLLVDSDKDGLPDTWEENGVDVDGDDVPDLDLPTMGADPDHKDMFIEVDFVAGHRIDQAQIDVVVEAFKQAPIANPDLQGGITLHVDNGPGSVMNPTTSQTWGALSDQESLTHQDVLGSDFTVNGVASYDWSEFESIRQTRLLGARRPVFRYAIAAHSGPNQRFSGIARGVPAADFLIATHENCGIPNLPLADECTPDPDALAATFMHELGHTLGLQHGGTDEKAYKPNYLSIMNYNFSWGLEVFDGSSPTSTTFEADYSRFNLSLNENALDEQRGFGFDSGPLTAFLTIYRCPGGGPKRTIPLETRRVDWNCDGSASPNAVAADVSADGLRTSLAGPIDWDRLVFSGGGIGGLNQPPGADDTVIDEPDPEELIESRALLEQGPGPEPPVALGHTTPPVTTPPSTSTGRRAAALKKCKRKHGKARAKCKKKAKRLPV